MITGAGACGLMAAIMAARNGAAVTVLEQNEKPGKKICATGNGRCNFPILQDRMMHTEANIRNLSKMHSESFLSRVPLSFQRDRNLSFKQERLSLSEKQSGAECCRCTVYGGSQPGCENKDK